MKNLGEDHVEAFYQVTYKRKEKSSELLRDLNEFDQFNMLICFLMMMILMHLIDFEINDRNSKCRRPVVNKRKKGREKAKIPV